MIGQKDVCAAFVVIIASTSSAFAEIEPQSGSDTYTGIYRPAGKIGESWSCDPASVGVDGGALAVTGGILEGVETRCALMSPLLHDDGSTQFTAICNAEGETYVEDLTLTRTKNVLSIARHDETVEWVFCHSTVEPDYLDEE